MKVKLNRMVKIRVIKIITVFKDYLFVTGKFLYAFRVTLRLPSGYLTVTLRLPFEYVHIITIDNRFITVGQLLLAPNRYAKYSFGNKTGRLNVKQLISALQ